MEGQILGAIISGVYITLMIALVVMVVLSVINYITEKRELKQLVQQERAKAEAPDIASNTKRTAALVALKSELETALLRDQISEDVANKLKSKYGFKEEKQSKEEE
jgi:uncharacterized membrane protein YcjF (UPF0283 family)